MQSDSNKKLILRWYDPILIGIVVPIIGFLLNLLLISYRVVSIEGLSIEKKALRETGNVIYGTWHQRIAYFLHFMRSRDIIVMVSQSRDGEYATKLAKLFNIGATRGSSTRGGREALKEIVQILKDGKNSGMLLDGPVGPARVAKIGTVIMSYKTGFPIIPVTWSAEKCWIFNSWDRFIIPKPFSKLLVCFGEPIRIPKTASREELEKYRELLQERLNDITSWSDKQFGDERPWRKVKHEGTPKTGPLI